MSRGRADRGQAAVLLVGALLAVLAGGVVLGGLARGVGAAGDAQRAADLAALAGARALHGAYFRLFEPPLIDGIVNPRHLAKAAHLELGRKPPRSRRPRTTRPARRWRSGRGVDRAGAGAG